VTRWSALLIAASLGAHAVAQSSATEPAPEPPSGRTEKPLLVFERMAVAAANPIAADVGYAILKVGGNAVDAAIAAQLVLGLVEPQSSGLGGGGFALVYRAKGHAKGHLKGHAKGQRLTSYDGRETAPAAARPDRFLGADGQPMPFRDAVLSSRSIGVPGLVPMLEAMHRAHGRLPWASLFIPAIELAENGFAVGPRLHTVLKGERWLRSDPAARALYYDSDGEPWPVGHQLKNPAYAATLRAIAKQGAKALSEGPIAEAIVAAARAGETEVERGDLTLADLAAYRVIERKPVCGSYRGLRVCGMGPPSSGGIAVAQMLAYLEPLPMSGYAPLSAEAVHALAEAGRLAFADRNRYLADPAFVRVPAGLLDRRYLAERAKLIDPAKSLGRADPGTPPDLSTERRGAFADDVRQKLTGTTHLSVVDREGNAVSMTSSIEDVFGSRRMAAGFLLNNQLTDFAFAPTESPTSGTPVANRVEPGKRPRSSMAPTMVFDRKGRLAIVTGSPGGSAIIGYVVKNLVAMVDWGLDAQAAADAPNVGSRNGPTELERGTAAAALRPALEARGHRVVEIEFTSGVQTLRRAPGGWQGGADPRREGAVRGE
jgi:gamma-glutamyltranspeptidase/glutathione hydrolase